MRVIADLHIHSRYSRATSPRLTPAHLDRWARIKGIALLGTGDCTHPAWLAELREQLDDAEEGLYTLKSGVHTEFDHTTALIEGLPAPGVDAGGVDVRFALTGEISTIYKKDGRTRKVHHVVLLSSFAAAQAFQASLERIGNIRSDGRPILGIDSRDLLALLLEADPAGILIPAHIWTPWFSALGAKSGFDSIGQCYGDLSSRISAVETGLSSNPPMNWAVPSLERFAIVSNSDAHSPERLGREATIFDMDLSFGGLSCALRPSGIIGTVEFFPQEGKYHYDGHRNCGVWMTPEDAAASGFCCPVCHKPLTRGVMGRVMELAGAPVDESAPCPPGGEGNRRPYYSLIPLRELLGELLGTGAGSKKVDAAYGSIINRGGSELGILMDAPLSRLEALHVPGLSGELLARSVRRMRDAQVSVTPGYDGEYGVVRVCPAGVSPQPHGVPPQLQSVLPQPHNMPSQPAGGFVPSPAQAAVIAGGARHALVIAGPGAGKTATVAARIGRLVDEGVDGASILAVTFTVKAAEELRGRIRAARTEAPVESVVTATFHSLCASILREQGVPAAILPDEARDKVLEEVCRGSGVPAGSLARYIEGRKRFLLLPGEQGSAEAGELKADMDALYERYRARLHADAVLDFDDLLAGTVRLLAARPQMLARYRCRFRHILVDEYQDINYAQYALIRLLAPNLDDAPSLWVIGDPNQAIYGFRGSDAGFIHRFADDYPDARRFLLSRSFRCAQGVAAAASRLVDTALEGSAGEVALYRAEYPSGKAEAEGIARHIAALIGGATFFAHDSGAAGCADGEGDAAPGDCAILLRTIALADPFVQALNDHGIPYVLQNDESRRIDSAGIAVEGVRIMTIHAAKGLEFPRVFVPALEDGLLPFILYRDRSAPGFTEHLAEEKRLLYVAMTRARYGLSLSWAKQRVYHGRMLENPPCRFLAALEDLVPLRREQGKVRQRDAQLWLFQKKE
ncbi:MAG: UvrD-helicase domain-containing protein [Spirochaetaceae bacterium]|jgi:DNA helicase-2/ATP-dependent DNA helicase PcrA|nr:UvrD-helicase domain-containing protein [Spirochaetaceae bacterium]